VDPISRVVQIPPGVSLDFGGFIKGWTVDRAAALLPDLGAVDAGGDAVLKGPGIDGRGWLVDVEDPFDSSRDLLTLRVTNGAVATSAPNRRYWLAGGKRQHHLINPVTGEPVHSDLAQVTVLAPTAEEADVLAKSVFILGSRRGRRLLRSRAELGAVLVSCTGAVQCLGRLELDNAA
jgi:FAD:protein FMN transferase